jgi:endonuclease/exonuclease/phosphatase family metal-dependent hydrolase
MLDMTSHPQARTSRAASRIGTATLAAALVIGLSTGLPHPTIATAAVPAAPAVALPAVASVSGLVVIPGKNQITASWAGVAGAGQYQVRVARSASMAGAVSVTTSSTTAVVGGLKTPKAYWVQVVAGTAVSAKVKTKTSKASTGRGTVTGVSRAGANAVQVTWKRFKVGTSIDVRLSWDNKPLVNNQAGRYVQVTGLPITATSTVLTIPDGYQRLIGSTTGNPAYLRLVPHNGPRSRNGKIAFGWPSAEQAYGTQLRVATFNVTDESARRSGPVPDWAESRGAVVNSIQLANPDILLTQEVPRVHLTLNGQDVTQDQDLIRLLSGQWSVSWNPAPSGQASWPSNQVYYRTSTFELLASGQVQFSSLVSADWSRNLNRYFAWAQLRVRATGEIVFAVSAHLQGDDSVNRRQLRRDLVRGLNGYLAQLNPRGYPVIVGGDFNVNFGGMIPSGFADAPQDMIDAGYVSAASADSRTNITRSSSNAGFPSKPRSYTYVGSRIDYLFLKNTAGPVSYTNQMVLNSNGTFNRSYYGSDHNLQWSQVSLG